MHLKKLQLHGFKTFAERTEITFSEGVTAVVGPNGSGKSNLGDAILWVLGEQKASAVRGAKASDVIFSGSDKRKPTGLAEVSLTVDNSDGTLPMAFDEVVITRRAYRTGEGEFFINKVPCRLKDIYELFLDTGVGRESYALVNQSQIDAVLSVNPEDRRGLFEEAAGIKKYRVKKREALRKLDATEANVNRVVDILREMDGRLEPLRLAAGRAEQYQKLRARLRSIESSLLIIDLRTAQDEYAAAQAARAQDEAALGRHQAQIAHLEAQALALGAALADAERAVEQSRTEAENAGRAAERAASSRLLAMQRAESLVSAQKGLAREQEELQERAGRGRAQIAEMEAEIAVRREEEIGLRRQVSEGQASVQALAERLVFLTRQGEKQRMEAAAQTRTLAGRQSDLARADARAAELAAGVPTWRGEAERLEAASAQAATALLAATDALAGAQNALKSAEDSLAEAQAARDTARQAARDTAAQANDLSGRLVAAQSRLRALQDLENAQEGYFAGVRAIFEARKHGALRGEFTVVADAFQAPPGYETALETALAASLQDIISDTADDAKAAIAFLHEHRAGRATFLPLDSMRPGRDTLDLARAEGTTGVRGAVLEIIEFNPKFRPALDALLGRVFVCETLDDAIRASRIARGWNRVVTLTGELVLPSGALTGGRQAGRTANLLGRKTEITRLQAEARDTQQRLNTLRAGEDKAMAALETAEAALSARRGEQQSAQLNLSEYQRQISSAQAEARRLDSARTEAQRRAQTAEAALSQAQDAADTARRALETLARPALDDAALAHDAEELRTVTAARDAANSDLTGAKIALATAGERVSSLDRALRAARADGNGISTALARRGTQQQDAGEEAEALQVQIGELNDAAALAGGLRDQASQDLARCQDARRALVAQAQDTQASLRAQAEAQGLAGQAAHQNELKEARVGARRDAAALRLWEEYEMRAEDALALPVDPAVADGSPQEVARLRRDLRAMGDVNTGAIEEWEQTHARHEFLSTQRADLDEARGKLLDAIREIDDSTRGVFMETFQAVSAAFGEIFTRLFGGGKTELALTDPNDLLETGIDVLVQPPGKKRQNLALLSGGERALTAAALLFAFLKVKPSPFCVLDEVDAPLDGANVERFADLLREFGVRSQFIIITHNPTTMEAAPLWYGVTMQEPGISRVLSMAVPDTSAPAAAR